MVISTEHSFSICILLEKRVRLQVPKKNGSRGGTVPSNRSAHVKIRPDSVCSSRPSTADSASQTEYTGITTVHINGVTRGRQIASFAFVDVLEI